MFRLIVGNGSNRNNTARVLNGNLRGFSPRPITNTVSKAIRQSSQQQQRRKLSSLNKEPSGINDAKLLEYMRVASFGNDLVMQTAIESAWTNGTLQRSDAAVREYIRAVVGAGNISKLNLNELMKDAQMAGAMTSANASAGVSAAANATIALGPGTTPGNPLYATVSRAPLTPKAAFRETMGKMLGAALWLGAFVGIMWYTGLLPEPGKAGGASSGLGRLTGMNNKTVRKAERPDKRFTDVVGVDEPKAELQEIVQYLKDPDRFTRLGGTLPRGVLLTGPPGTGKTLLAKAIAGEAGVPFFYAAGSEFEEMFVGVGASRVRELFAAAKAVSPCIIFLDEIDAMGGSRNLKDQSAMKMTLNQLLTEMDGFETNPGIIVIGATNFAEALDKALLRPGRFDKHVEVPLPDVGGRLQILELYGSKVPLDDDVDFQQLARGTPGFSGAELHNLINQAALKAAMDGLQSIAMSTLEYAKDKILMGAERRSAVLSPESMRCTAFHEAGHALMALKTDGAHPIHKATIMPRGRALGMVMQLPDGDQTSMTRKQMLANMDVCMGGRVAEELVFGVENVTSGASSDIMQATRIARAMITKYGFSDKLGFIFIDKDESPVAGTTSTVVDEEVRKLLDSSYARAKAILTTHRAELNKIAAGLLEYESLSGNEIVDLCKDIKPAHGVKRSQKPSRQLKEIPLTPTTPGSGAGKSKAPTTLAATDASVNAKSLAPPVAPPVPAQTQVRRSRGPPVVAAPSSGQDNENAQKANPAPSSSESASSSSANTTRGPPKI